MTAMQELIIKINSAKENFPGIGFSEEFIRGFNKAMGMAVFIIDTVGIPSEKNGISDAYEAGAYDFQGKNIEVTNGDGLDYYDKQKSNG